MSEGLVQAHAMQCLASLPEEKGTPGLAGYGVVSLTDAPSDV